MKSDDFRIQFRNLIVLTWTLPAIVGLSFILFIELLTTRQLIDVIKSPLESTFILGSLLLAVWYFNRRVNVPFCNYLDNPTAENEALAYKRTRLFIIEYWALFLGYLLVAPSTVIISAEYFSDFQAQPVDWFRIHLVALIVSIIVGLPIFFNLFDLFGRALSGLALARPLFTIRVKIFLIAALVPLLIDTMLVQYYWTRTGFFNTETFIIWLTLELLAIAGAIMFARSFAQSLEPLETIIKTSRPFSEQDFSDIRPTSLDELGILANRFRGVLEELKTRGYVMELINRIHQNIDRAVNQGEALESIVDAGLNALGDEICFLLLADRKNNRLIGVCHTGEAYNPLGYYLIDLNETSLATHTFNSTKVVSTEDATRDGRCKSEIVTEYGIRSAIAAPMITANETIGVLISSTQTRSRTYDDHDHMLMEELAREAALVINTHGLQETLYLERGRANITLQSIGDGVITTDTKGVIDYINPVAETITGYSLNNAKGKPVGEVFNIYNEDTSQSEVSLVQDAILNSEILHITSNVLLKNSESGTDSYIEFSLSPIRGKSEVSNGAVLTFRDVSRSRKMAKRMAHLSTHDTLTGLINRAEFENRLERAIQSAREAGQQHVLCYLDLDQFKMVNDTCGHIAGDELLKQLTSLLQSQVETPHTLARLGGDEFGILYEKQTLPKAIKEVERILAMVRNYRFTWDGRRFEIGASIGITTIDADSVSKTELMKSVDSACYIAKDTGRNRIHIYQVDDIAIRKRHREMEWVGKLRHALDNDRFVLYSQPITELQATQEGFNLNEVLLRMKDDDDELILPTDFITAAERYNLMPDIDRWVIRNVFARMQKTGNIFNFAINLSGQSLCDESMLDYIINEIHKNGIDCSRICFEITETSAITNLPHAMHIIDSLRRMGCRFALDDFGSGLSSFGYLKNLYVDYIKIDGSFVQDIINSPVSASIVEAINKTGHIMGIKTIAEYVENRQILEAVRELGVDYAQGYNIGHPAPIKNIIELYTSTGKSLKH